MTIGRDELRQRLQQWAHNQQWYGWEDALLGGIQDGQQVIDAPGRPGWVIVRIIRGDTITQTEAINLGVRNIYGLPVQVGRTRRGQLAVKGLIESEAVARGGQAAAAFAVPDVVLTGIIDERRFEPLLVQPRRISGAYTMSVYINSGWYRDKTGKRRYYPGGWLDLTPYIPGQDKRRLVLVGINTLSNIAAAVASEEYGLATQFNEAYLAALDEGDLLPLAGVNVAYGMTEIARESDIIDARVFFSVGGDGGGGIVIPGAGAWNPDLAPATPHDDDDEFDDNALGAAWTEVDSTDIMTVTEADGTLRLILNEPYSSHLIGEQIGIHRAAPSGDFQIIVKLRIHVVPDSATLALIILTFPTENLLAGVSIQQSPDIRFITLGKRGYSGGFGAAHPGNYANDAVGPDEWMYIRLRYDSTQKILWAQYGTDGQTWYYTTNIGTADLSEDPDGLWLGVACGDTEVGNEAAVEFEFYRVRDGLGAVDDPVYGRNEDVLSEAGNVSYAPTETAHWPDPPPTSVQEALDMLAEMLSGL